MKSIEAQLTTLLDSYSEEIQDAADKIAKKKARAAANELKQTSPQRTGEYARSWTVKDNKDHSFVAWNRKHWQLTHLLEDGHVIISHGVAAGRTRAFPHIVPAAEKYGREFVEETEREIDKL